MSCDTLAGIAFSGVKTGDCLDAFTLRLAQGDCVALLGSNGVGKTTLLRLAAGLLECESGSTQIARPVGYVPQDYRSSLLPWMSVRDNIALPLRAAGLAPGEEARRVGEIASVVRLEGGLLKKHPYHLSGGEQQRVTIARALANEPRVLLLDEPFSALDLGSKLAIRQVLAEWIAARGATMLLVTHDLDDAGALAHRALVLSGRPLGVAADLTLHEEWHPELRQALLRSCGGWR